MRLYSIEIRNPNPKWSFDWGAHAPGAWPLHPQSAIPYPFPFPLHQHPDDILEAMTGLPF